MSQENLELCYRAQDAFNRRDLDAYLALMDDDVEIVPRAGAMEGESSYRRHDGVRRWWNNVLDVFPDWNAEVVEVRDLDDLTFALIRLSGHGAGSTAPTDQATWNVARWQRGKCVWWRFFQTRAEALEAVGLSDQAMSQENVKVAKASYEAWNAGDMDALRELHDPDVIIVRTPEGWPEPGPFVGREAVMRQFGQLRETWDADALELIGDFAAAADRVVVRQNWRGAGHGPESNMELTVVFTVRKGRIFLIEYFWDHAEALEAVGLWSKTLTAKPRNP